MKNLDFIEDMLAEMSSSAEVDQALESLDSFESLSPSKRQATEDAGTTDGGEPMKAPGDLQKVFNKLYGKSLPSGKAGETLESLIANMQKSLNTCAGDITHVDAPPKPQGKISRLELAYKAAVEDGGKFSTRNTAVGRQWAKYLKANPIVSAQYNAPGTTHETHGKIRKKWVQEEYTDMKDACQIAEVYQFKIRHCIK